MLELVEGETLAEKLEREGTLPVPRAREIALQIARGLEAAHEKGIVHRDLKPSNLQLTPEGQVKILDFGLAKPMEPESPVDSHLSQSPTIAMAATRAGIILGTATYMSPEQARGKPVDRRTDIWAFGCVLFEMLAGGLAFRGSDVSEILAAVIKSEPGWEQLPSDLPLQGTEGGSHPFFSPDGRWIGFFAEGKLKKTSIDGGKVLTLAEAPAHRGAVWGSSDIIIYSPEYDSGLWKIRASGGTPEALTTPDPERNERTHRWPDLLPNDRGVLFTIGHLNSPGDYDDAQIAIYSFETGQTQVLIEGGNMARFVAPGYLIYARGGTLFAAGFDPGTMAISREPAPVLEEVAGNLTSGAGYFAIAANGTLAYMPGSATTARSLMTIVDAQGQTADLPLPPRGYQSPRFSPDAQSLAFTIGEMQFSGAGDIWILDLASNGLTRFTFGDFNMVPI